MISLRATANALFDRFAPGAVVLLYHRVTDFDFDPQLLAVKPANFGAQLDALQRSATLVPLDELPEAIRKRGSGRGLAAITFDDGYADNLHEAKPLLARRGIPATVFVASGYCASGRELWWDELERVFLRPGTLPAKLSLTIGTYDVSPAVYDQAAFDAHRGWNVLQAGNPTPRHALYRALLAALGKRSVAEREQILAELRAWASSPASARESHRPLTPGEVSELQSGGVSVGAHTVSHPRLSALDAGAQQREIEESKRDLERFTGAPVKTFAYPFGGYGDYTRASVAAARAHFDVACSNFPATVRAHTSRFEMPRFLVRDWSAAELQSRLGRLLRS